MKYSDDDAIFHYLCNQYDANAYMKMGEEEQALYDRLVNGINMLKNEDIKAKLKENELESNCTSMIFTTGCMSDNIPEGFEKIYNCGNELLDITNKMAEITA
jgi:hypothetical protein